MFTATKTFPINQNLDVLIGSWFSVIYYVWCSYGIDLWLVCRCFTFFVVFISSSCCFTTTPWCWRWKKIRWGDKGVAMQRWRQNKKDWCEMKNKNERKKKERKEKKSKRKTQMWAIYKHTTPRDLGPAHLLLFTSEEIDTLWKRGFWPRDKTTAAPN